MMFDQKNFSQEVINYSGLVLVDFFAPWCGPCQAQGPVIEGLADEYKDKAKIGKLNVEEAIEVAQQYNVMSIPALIFFKNGKEIKRLDGFCGRDELVKELDVLLK
ncbi:MAG: thioredoxin [Candidatus Parcubacteria bacterium]|nr:thioredoxin [Candidatus Parcubacteria bacterium]